MALQRKVSACWFKPVVWCAAAARSQPGASANKKIIENQTRDGTWQQQNLQIQHCSPEKFGAEIRKASKARWDGPIVKSLRLRSPVSQVSLSRPGLGESWWVLEGWLLGLHFALWKSAAETSRNSRIADTLPLVAGAKLYHALGASSRLTFVFEAITNGERWLFLGIVLFFDRMPTWIQFSAIWFPMVPLPTSRLWPGFSQICQICHTFWMF